MYANEKDALMINQLRMSAGKNAQIELKNGAIIIKTSRNVFVVKPSIKRMKERGIGLIARKYIPYVIGLFEKHYNGLFVKIDVFDTVFNVVALKKLGKAKKEVFKASVNLTRAKSPGLWVSASDGLFDTKLMRAVNKMFDDMIKQRVFG